MVAHETPLPEAFDFEQNVAFVGELEGIGDQVDEYLFDPADVRKEFSVSQVVFSLHPKLEAFELTLVNKYGLDVSN